MQIKDNIFHSACFAAQPAGGGRGGIILLFALYVITGSGDLCRAEGNLRGPAQSSVHQPMLRDTAGERGDVAGAVMSADQANSGHRAGGLQDMRATMSGLQEAGFSLPQVVTFLKNSGKSAAEIGRACIQAGFAGAVVFDALCQADFPLAAVQAAIPASLRMEQPQLSLIDNDRDAGAALLGAGSIQAAGTDKSENTLRDKPAARSGIQFNGLGNWQRFQEQRFHSLENRQ